jgi:shikimate kinase
LEEIVEVLEIRRELYRQCADLIVDTEDKTPAQVADEILAKCRLKTQDEE